MAIPFTQESELFVNFAKGVLLPNDSPDGLIRSTEKVHKQMNTFVEKRFNTNQVSF